MGEILKGCVTMEEYISKQRAKDLMGCCLASAKANYKDETSVFKKEQFKHYAETIEAMIDVVGSVEAADVQPVKYGKWEETHISLVKYIPEDKKEEGHSFYMAELKCSCCERYNAVTFALTLNKPDFCQLCGARMIKDGDFKC